MRVLALPAVALAAFLVGALVDPFGGGAERAPAEVPRRAQEPTSTDGTSEAELRAPGIGAAADPAREAAGDRTPLPGDPEDEMFSRALLEHHASEFVRGWKTVRSDTPPEPVLTRSEALFRQSALLVSARMGENAAEDRTRSEELERSIADDDGPAMLEAFRRGDWEPDEDFFAGDTLERLTRAATSKASVDGVDFLSNREQRLEDGVTLTFGPGVFELDERRLRAADDDRIPNDLTIVGAGRDATLLQMGDLGARGSFERLTFRDITLDAQNDGLFDHRSDGATVSFRRARIVRFDAGHGGCTIFSLNGGVFLDANDLEILGGYGSSPGNGSLLDGRGTIARFRNCRFELVEMRKLRSGNGARVEFSGCSFALFGPDPREWARSELVFNGCSYRLVERTADDDGSRSIQDLFPDAR
ncbi:MAG: hypothetical protein AAGB93_14300 [Planctomycetota bacterium]